MIAFRDKMAKEYGFDLISHTNPDGVRDNINPFDHGRPLYRHHEDGRVAAGAQCRAVRCRFGGARRDEEKSRAKERVFSHRAEGILGSANQRPEMWRVLNTRLNPGESMRVFPLSNWTELDIWTYILPKAFRSCRSTSPRSARRSSGSAQIMVDDERLPLKAGEKPREPSWSASARWAAIR
jgi:sulfate adenylyltransferase subunit 2